MTSQNVTKKSLTKSARVPMDGPVGPVLEQSNP